VRGPAVASGQAVPGERGGPAVPVPVPGTERLAVGKEEDVRAERPYVPRAEHSRAGQRPAEGAQDRPGVAVPAQRARTAAAEVQVGERPDVAGRRGAG